MEKRVVLDQIEIKSDGDVFMRLLKQIVDDDGVTVINGVGAGEPHRSVVEPHINVADQFNTVNAHLKHMGWPEVPAAEIKRFDDHAKVARTPQVIAAWNDKLQKQKAEQAAREKP